MNTRESTVEKQIRLHAEGLGMLVYKFTSPGRRGVPDRMFVTRKGMVWFMEVKKKGEELSPLQARQISLLRERGVYAMWTDNAEEGKRMVDDLLSK